MKPPSEEVLSAAEALRAGASADDLSMPAVRLGIDAGFGPVRLARPAGGHIAVLVPTALGRRLDEGLSGEGLHVRLAQYTLSSGQVRPFVEVSCSDPGLESVFLSLTSAVLSKLTAGRPPESAVAETIGDFRDLMRRSRVFPVERLIGLAGELHVLGRLAKLRSDAANSWTGPLKQRHDFSLPGACVESKATLHDGAKIHIHGLDQLEPPDDGRPLLIAHLRYEHGGAGGLSLYEVIQEVRGRCGDTDVFDARMVAMELGHWQLIECFKRERFLLKDERYYRVDAGFPRLSKNSFLPGHPAAGVSAIEYRLDLAHAAGFSLSIEQAESLMLAEAP